MIAHICKSGDEQSLKEHLEHVSSLCRRFSEPVGVSAMAELIGLLHDMGKGTNSFQMYLRWRAEHDDAEPLPKHIKHHKHAPTGAIYAYDRWFCNGNPIQKRTAQIIALCIYGHHTGLMDCADQENPMHFQTLLEQDKNIIFYQEAVSYFLNNIADEAHLDRLFASACEEFRQKTEALTLKQFPIGKGERYARSAFQAGMLTRFLLSVLIDADRWDSACFEYGRDSMKQSNPAPDWAELSERYEAYARETFTGTGELDRKRQEISDLCVEKADGKTGIYRLSVPTGGGKTFASLRFAMKHAKENGQQRIFYIIPYNTILDQNAKDIRDALGHYEGILEHHSNVVIEENPNKKHEDKEHADGKWADEERVRYRRMTERWDSDIILTSMVQFLNALFRCENTNARRMHRLTNAVLIFDEIQALPRHCKGLFERAVTFLTTCCHSTVLLCTATQLELKLPVKPEELMGTEEELTALNHALKRVEYLPQIRPARSNQQAADGLFTLLTEKSSVLMIANTKAAAWDVYEKTCERLKADDYDLIDIQPGLKDEEIREQARCAENFEILCVYLSTLLCPAHRKEYIRWVINWTKGGGRALCISTALIEAGINVSFPVVVRSLASLPSIVQAAGRCNRNREQAVGEVYIWELAEEKLSSLEEIKQGKDISRMMIERWDREYDALSDPEGIRLYFGKEQEYTKNHELYPIGKNTGLTVVGLLSDNPKRTASFKKKPPLNQSFQEAGEAFEVIPQKTKPVIVPYREGEELIAQLNGSHTMEEEIRLMRQMQQYCVNLYDNMYSRLAGEDALYPVGENGIIALKKEYYSEASGIKTEAGELEEMII